MASNLRGGREEESFTEEQTVAILREADLTSVAQAAKKQQGRTQFGQLEVQDVKRLKALELENCIGSS